MKTKTKKNSDKKNRTRKEKKKLKRGKEEKEEEKNEEKQRERDREGRASEKNRKHNLKPPKGHRVTPNHPKQPDESQPGGVARTPGYWGYSTVVLTHLWTYSG